jgi:DNA-directed RNA polymerase subunit A'
LLLRTIHKVYGEDFAIDFLGKIFRLGIAVQDKRGFTTTISDTDLPEVTRKKIQDIFVSAENEVKRLIEQYNEGALESFPGKTIKETLEIKMLELLNKARNDTGAIVAENAEKDSHTIIMAASGARGTLLNLAQMAGCVGQQALRGKRIEKGFRDRTLSCFKPNDLGSEARGFIKSSFKDGLNPSEFFFQSMVGRDSLMDTALRTPKSGYLYRRLANAMQDLRVEYDGSVRDASGKIVQFIYGEDGIDVSKSEGGALNVSRLVAKAAVR